MGGGHRTCAVVRKTPIPYPWSSGNNKYDEYFKVILYPRPWNWDVGIASMLVTCLRILEINAPPQNWYVDYAIAIHLNEAELTNKYCSCRTFGPNFLTIVQQ